MKMRSTRGVRTLLAIFAAFTAAAGLRVAAAPAVPSAGPAVQEHKLPNGLTVITQEIHTAPVVSFAVWYRVGSRNEHTGITGVSHLLEHLMFKGTKNYQLGEISRTLFVNGAQFNASTYFDWTNYYATLASDRLELAMKIEADRMTNSRIDKADLESEMTVVRSELEGGENNPTRRLSQAVWATAYSAHPYQWPVIGFRTDVENVSRDAIYNYYKTHYGPNNAVAVIVGDFKTEDALKLVNRYFGGIKPIATPTSVYTEEPPQRGERRVNLQGQGSLPATMIGYHIPAWNHPDMYALDVLSTILSNGRTSRLYQVLVETNLATSASASAPSLKDPSLFTFFAQAAPNTTADQLEKVLLTETERLRAEPVTAEELNRARTQIEADFVYNRDSITSQANQLGYYAILGDWRYLDTYLERVRALTPARLQEVAAKYFVPENRTVGQFTPTAAGRPTPPAREASARVEKPKRGARPVPLPKPAKAATNVDRRITRFTLANGIKVIVQENPSNPTFALRASLPAGGVFDPANRPGLATITASMLNRGTQRHTPLAFAAELENVGATLSADADELTTAINGRAQTKDFDRVMDLMADMLRQPSFPEGELDKLKAQYAAAFEEEKTDTDTLANRAFGRAIYPVGNPLRPPTLEESETAIQGLSRDELLNFYRKQYGPDRMIVVVAGDVKADRVRSALEQRLGSWARNPAAATIPTIDVPLQAKALREVIQVPEKSETTILYGFGGGLKRSDPDFYATQVVNMILGGGGALNSRLGNVIRDEQGLAYSVFSFYDAGLYPGPFTVMMGTNPGNTERAITSLQAEIERIRSGGVTQRELDEAVAYLTGSFPLRLQTNAGMANLLWQMEFYNLGPDYIDRYGEYYRAVTLAQVNEAARKHLHPDRATLIVAGTVPAK